MLHNKDCVFSPQSAVTEGGAGENAVSNSAKRVSFLCDIGVGLSQIESVVNEMASTSCLTVDEVLSHHCTDQGAPNRVKPERLCLQQHMSQLADIVRKLKEDLGRAFDDFHSASESKRNINFVQSDLDVQLCCHRCTSWPNSNDMAESSSDSGDQSNETHAAERFVGCKLDVSTAESTMVSKSAFECLLDDSKSDTVCEIENGSSANNREHLVTAAANRSLDLSRSLTEKCAQLADLQLIDSNSSSNCSSYLVSEKYNLPSSDDQVTAVNQTSTLNGERLTEVVACTVRRRQVILEIFDTERKYCSCLQILLNHFSASLRQSDIVPSNDIEVIFPPCLAHIHEFHRSFLLQLECRLAAGQQETSVGDLLDSFVTSLDCELLEQYKLYVGRLPDALVKLRVLLKQNMGFCQIVKGLQLHQSCEGLDVSAFLLTPVQRIPRYVLLLKQLIKNTDTVHCDYFYLERSMSRLGDLLTRLNGSIEQSMTAVTVAHAASPSPKPRRRFQLNTFSFRTSSCNTPCDRRNFDTRYQRKDGNSALPVVGWPRSRRHLPSSTSTPVASLMFPVHSDVNDSTQTDFALCHPKPNAAPGIALEKENSFKWPSLSSAKNAFQPSSRSRLKSFPSNVDCSGSLFDISNITWDQEAGDNVTKPSYCNGIPSPKTAVADIYGSIPALESVSSFPMPPVLPTEIGYGHGAMSVKRKLSNDSTGSNGFGILRKLTRRKSLKVSGCEQSIVSEANTSTMSLRRKPSLRDSIKTIFSRKRAYIVRKNATISCTSPMTSSASILETRTNNVYCAD